MKIILKSTCTGELDAIIQCMYILLNFPAQNDTGLMCVKFK